MNYYSKIHKSKCRILEEEILWEKTVCKIWISDSNIVVTVPKEDLITIEEYGNKTEFDKNIYKSKTIAQAAAGKVTDAIASCGKKNNDDGVLLAPLESAVTPLPHQLNVLKKVIQSNPARFLLADEVGLGKTIEAGLVMQELKLRGLVKRVLIVVPTGLINQWISEMKVHFNEEFQHYVPSELANFSKYFTSLKTQFDLDNKNSDSEFNPWTLGNNIICPMDAIKPLVNRKGWSKEEIEKYNSERFLNVVNGGWDLVIIDEAHRVAGADPTVARYKLGWGLGQATPHILLLSATPHQGKSDAFHRLFTILDEDAFPDERHVTRKTIEPYLLRNEKRTTKDAQGNILFKPRRTKLTTVAWNQNHKLQSKLYEEVTEYIKEGYNSIERLSGSQKAAIGFLLVLIQRLVTSSTAAVAKTLNKRLSFLKGEVVEEQKTSTISAEDWEEMDGDKQVETSMSAKVINRGEIKYVASILQLAEKTLLEEVDVKTEKLLSLIYDLQVEENNTDLKVLIFTEFTATQQMLSAFLNQRGFKIAMINGSMPLEERYVNMKLFANEADIMIATEAGGEGLNLQFCHVIVNYDMPWNPMRIEQRIGRVDRIGQKKDVLAVNMMISDTVECRVREVIETKLQVILAELGVDKLGDILDSAEAGKVFEQIYTEAVKTDKVDAIDESMNKLKEKLKEVRKFEELYLPKCREVESGNIDYTHHPFPFWVEQMTINYVLSNNGKAQKNLDGWEIVWPDGEKQNSVVFSASDMEKFNDSNFLSVSYSKIKRILNNSPYGNNDYQCVININSLPESISGIWSLWEIEISNKYYSEKKVLPLFIHNNGKIFPSTAKAVWDLIISGDIEIIDLKNNYFDITEFKRNAENSFKTEYHEMLAEFNFKLDAEKIKKEKMFESKRNAINKVGIGNIRQSRVKSLEHERQNWLQEMEVSSSLIPCLNLLMIVQIKPKS